VTDNGFRRTALVEAVEEALRVDVPNYIVEAYFGQGLTDAEIADEMGVAPSTARAWRVRLALPSFRDRRAAIQRTIEWVRQRELSR
jgi:hypothetical protein